jgi:hypothetical protein
VWGSYTPARPARPGGGREAHVRRGQTLPVRCLPLGASFPAFHPPPPSFLTPCVHCPCLFCFGAEFGNAGADVSGKSLGPWN